MNDAGEFARLGAEHIRTADDNLLAHADLLIGVARQQGIDQLKVLHDYALV